MARGQNNGITILLGLENYQLGEVWGEEDCKTSETLTP